MSITPDWKTLGGIVAVVGGALGAMWRKIRKVEIKTDGMLEWRSRAEIAEAKLEEKDAQRDIVEHHRQEDREDRKQ